MHPALPTLSLIISNDFLILTMARRCFFLLLHTITPAKIFLHSSCLIFQFKHHIIWIITHKEVISFIYLFLFQQRHIPHQTLLGYIVRWVFPLAPFVTDCLSASMVVKTQPLCAPLAKRRIRRIMAMTDFHHWSVVYHSCSKSLLTQFGHVNCKMWCQMMLDKEGVD